MGSDLARRQAAEAERISANQPVHARELAEAALRQATLDDDQLALLLAERALGLAARELSDLPTAQQHLRRSIAIAEGAGLREEAAESRVRLANVISLAGDTEGALELLGRVEASSTGLARVRARSHAALVYYRVGRFDEALVYFRMVIPALRRLGLVLDEAQALNNRGVVHTYRGDFAAAEKDLQRAESLAPAAGEGFAAAKVHHNFGFLAASRGDVPEALARFDQAQLEFKALGLAEGPVLSDRAETLLTVGLASEGLDAASSAVAELEHLDGSALDLAEARLMQARALLLVGETREAAAAARKARAAFRRQRRWGFAALADYVVASATLTRGRMPINALTEIAGDLEAAGWLLPSLELRLAWARRELGRAEDPTATRELRVVARHRRRGPAQIRAHGWHAEAMLRLAAGDRAGGQSALRAGLRVLDEHHATLGATELRVHAASRAEEIATLGCRLAIEEGRPRQVLEWAERWRAGALQLAPVRPPVDERLETLLGQLRHVTAELQRAALNGEATEGYLRGQMTLEEEIRDQARHAKAGRYGRVSKAPTPAALRQLLGERALVEYVALDGRLHAVTITEKRMRLIPLGPLSEIATEIDSLRFSYARLARGRGSEETKQTFTNAAHHAASVLDDRLFGALRGEIEERPLVVVPTGRLHHLPWGGLPSCATKVVSVAPSASLWAEAASAPATKRRGRVLLAAGPGLEHAEAEVRALALLYPRATTLVGDDATTTSVGGALDGAEVAHLAAHGNFRSDNPLFSSLQLADGQLTVYNFEQLRSSPRLLVLSACESGLSDVRPGDELLGLSAAVLSLGTINLMASIVTVPDITTAALMVEVHRHLRDGATPPAALAGARQLLDASGEADLIATAGFVCFGA